MKLQNYRNLEEALDAARAYGCELVEADDTTLLLDLDGTDELRRYYKILAVLAESEGLSESEIWPSRTKGCWHAVVKLAEPKPLEHRLRLQSLLGSDPMREALHWREMRSGGTRVVLFRPKKVAA